MYHIYRASRLAHGGGDQDDAKVIIEDVQKRIDSLPAEQAKQVLDSLLHGYGLLQS